MSGSYSLFKTPVGWCGVVNSERGILRILLGYQKRRHLLKQIVDEFGKNVIKAPTAAKIVETIKRYFSGEKVCFRCALEWSSLSPFQRKVFKAAMKIPYGTIESYGRLARRAGFPNGSRAVGGALSTNPFPLVVPCHRIVREDGGLGGFSAGGGVTLKKKILKLEGIKFNNRNKIQSTKTGTNKLRN